MRKRWTRAIQSMGPIRAVALALALLLALRSAKQSRMRKYLVPPPHALMGDRDNSPVGLETGSLDPHRDVAIVSAITGDIDRPQVRPDSGEGVFVYDESTQRLPFPRHDVNQRLRSKYFKMSTHWLHPEYAAYIWVDGAFEVDPAGLRPFMVEALQSADCAFVKHPNFKTIVQEMEFMNTMITDGSEYLRVRYEGEPMKAQVDAYLAEGFPADEYPLLMGGLFIRRNLPRVNAAFDHWLIENFKWTIQDQLSLPYILWKHNLSFHVIDEDISSGPHFKHTGHVNLYQ